MHQIASDTATARGKAIVARRLASGPAVPAGHLPVTTRSGQRPTLPMGARLHGSALTAPAHPAEP
jgi:hypothetical protein